MKNEIYTVFNFHFALYIKKKAHKRQIDNSSDTAHLSDENKAYSLSNVDRASSEVVPVLASLCDPLKPLQG